MLCRIPSTKRCHFTVAFIVTSLHVWTAAYLGVAHDIFRPERLLNTARLPEDPPTSSTSALRSTREVHTARLLRGRDILPLPPRSARGEPATRAPLPALGDSAGDSTSALPKSDFRSKRRSSTGGSRSARPDGTGSMLPSPRHTSPPVKEVTSGTGR
jgi:hypothetical protein